MCEIVKEKVSFPFPELQDAPGPEIKGTITIHRNGSFSFHAIVDSEAMTWEIHKSVVESSYDGVVPDGEENYYRGEYPRL